MFALAESDPELSKDDASLIEDRLRTALLKAQYARLKQQNCALLIVIAGIDGAGKGATVAMLNEWMDARHIRTLAFGPPAPDEHGRPWLWRYWQQLPAKGKTGIVFGSWYRPLLKEAARKKPRQKRILALSRVIRDFENTLAQNGVQVVKLWYHLSQRAQVQRTEKLLSDPDTAWRVKPEDLKVKKKFPRLRDAGALAITLTHETHAPWVVIPAADTQMREISTGQVVLAALRKRRIAPAQPLVQASEAIMAPPAPSLADLDYDAKLEDDEYDTLLPDWQGRLARLVRHEKFAQTPVVLVFEGQDAAGKGGTIRRITHALDPRQFRAIPISAPTKDELAHPYLWRFWRDLPIPGHISIFDRSWYGRVLVERVEKYASETEWQRAYDEINQFESQLLDSGTVVLKFWLAVSKEEQLKRFHEREASPFKSFKITPEDWRNRKQWDAYIKATNDMFQHTSTQACPWHMVSANDKRHARVAVLRHVVRALEDALGLD
ncbi:polyphosphate:AMP phosphotransferase [Pollutimonas harenae]|uniref:Polyphosphate:AMP phosphotransferase n=1 Tax=Pollutimonas harenae TaxID=657015 RepID=A0A853H306_9BURK|nr:polyphosphate:AMP phosphotransferase [Pollutimonas harenae]NYT84943.1 polyphosphate:AMP phosphotransferase [Pollutimonas harenae]TEA72665.1 polyphosphate:AMP phosphotransferase [Pollutimonas harenae]